MRPFPLLCLYPPISTICSLNSRQAQQSYHLTEVFWWNVEAVIEFTIRPHCYATGDKTQAQWVAIRHGPPWLLTLSAFNRLSRFIGLIVSLYVSRYSETKQTKLLTFWRTNFSRKFVTCKSRKHWEKVNNLTLFGKKQNSFSPYNYGWL